MITDGLYRKLPTAFSVVRRQKIRGRQRDEKHLAFIRTLPCLVSGSNFNVEAAHIRYSDAKWEKVNPGNSAKPHDMWTVRCAELHRLDPINSQHSMNEREFWVRHEIDPLSIAQALYAISGDYEAGLKIIREARQ